LPVEGPPLAWERYFELMAGDKKAAAGRVRYVVLQGVGQAVLRHDLQESDVRAAIAAASPNSAAAASR
jgi:3-dehydroquinate synthase